MQRVKAKKSKRTYMALFTGVIFFVGVWTSQWEPVKAMVTEYGIQQLMLHMAGNKIYFSDDIKGGGMRWLLEKVTGTEEKMQYSYNKKWENVDYETIKRMEKENKEEIKKEQEFLLRKEGNVKKEKKEKQEVKQQKPGKNSLVEQLKKTKKTDYLLKNFYIVDSTTSVDKSIFNVKEFLEKDFSITKEEKPQILIYHTHGGTEQFLNGKGEKDSVIGAGDRLTEVLEEQYGYEVLHDKTKYDCLNGKTDRNRAYNNALKGVQSILKKHPSIQVIIDLHRDGVNNDSRRVTQINGENVAQFMIFNGLSRNRKGNIAYLYNPYLKDNLAFGLQVKIEAMERYPDLTIKNYLKAYRYNMHLRERFLLIELGNENTTPDEAKNAMPYLAEVVDAVLTK